MKHQRIRQRASQEINAVRTGMFRRTTQKLAPVFHPPTDPGCYDIYPAFPIGSGRIGLGFESLARRLASHPVLVIDGYGGVLWEFFRESLDRELRTLGVQAHWTSIDDAARSDEELTTLIQPYLGGNDPLWGTLFTGELGDFFDPEQLLALRPDPAAAMNIIYGSGAALAGWDGHLLYVDLPKNEIQFRSRSGVIRNLGASRCEPAKEMYKRFYFVDWPALNRHKRRVLPHIGTIVDEQRPAEPAWADGCDLRAALDAMSRSVIRPRPWFEPGPWGGQWIKRHMPELPQDTPNYAWSFEMIAPENGLALHSDGVLLEVSFDFLMFHRGPEVLGGCAERFGTEFPIRFNFLDTYGGGNLSIQCHPRTGYIREHFGERCTQDETYYILDCEPGARVYLGFRDGIDPDEFRRELEQSQRDGTPIEADRFIHSEPAHRGDLFLIPNGTIHCSGTNNLVLEISATPYIFTFKMYDWLRRDLEGNLRPLNIARAYENLYFDRKGERITREFVSKPATIAQGNGWRIVHLPTHAEHFYDVRRLEFDREIAVETDNTCHVLNLVRGSSIVLKTADGTQRRFNYAETFVIPAAAGSYRLINEGMEQAAVIQAFVKYEACHHRDGHDNDRPTMR